MGQGFSTDCTAIVDDIVQFKDASFRRNIINAYDLNKDRFLQKTEAASEIVFLEIPSDESITDLTGTELFAALETLIAKSLGISSINISNSLELSTLDLRFNMFTSLDLSKFTKLTRIELSGNPLSALNVTNGNNIGFHSFSATTTGGTLPCIEVDDAVYSEEAWRTNPTVFVFDHDTRFSEDCSQPAPEPEPDPNPVTGLDDGSEVIQEFKIYPNPTTDFIKIGWEGNESFMATIHNLLGEKQYQARVLARQNIHIGHFRQGVYIVALKNGNGQVIKKLRILKED